MSFILNKHFPQTLQIWFLPWLHNGFWWLSSVHRGAVETWSWTNQGSKLLMQVRIQSKLLFPTHCFASPLGHCFAVIQGTAFLYHCIHSGTTWKSQLCYSCAKVHTAFRSPLLVFYQFPKKRKLLIIELRSLKRFFVNALTGCHPGHPHWTLTPFKHKYPGYVPAHPALWHMAVQTAHASL